MAALVVCQFEDALARDRVVVDRRSKGYRLRASDAWKVSEPAPSGVDSMISMADPLCTVNVVVVPATGLTEISDDRLKTFYEKTGKTYVNRTFLKQKLETHRGKPSGWYELTGELKQRPGVLYHFRQYFTLHRGYLYVITVASPDVFWQKSLGHWRKVIQSMEFV